jgi:hypothetical protein
MFAFSGSNSLAPFLTATAIVVYHPINEKRGNYVPSVMADRYDAFIFWDKTRALHPLHMKPHDEKMPERYPFGL